MSVLLSAKAWGVPVGSANRKMILLKLADNANDNGICWPSYDYLAAHCEMNKRTVQRHIDALERCGFLERTRRYGGPNNNLTNVFKLTLEKGDISRLKSDKKGAEIAKANPKNPAKSSDENIEMRGDNLSKPEKGGAATTTLRGGNDDIEGRHSAALNHHRTVKEPSLKKYIKKPKFIREIFDRYPAHRRGGTDQLLWKTWKQEKLTESDAAKLLDWLTQAAQSDPQWGTNAGGQFVHGLVKFIRERIWLTPVPVAQNTSSHSLDMDDMTWAENLNEGIL